MTKMTLLEKAKEMGLEIVQEDSGEFARYCPDFHGLEARSDGLLCKQMSTRAVLNKTSACVECYAREYDPNWETKVATEKPTEATTRRYILESAIQCVCADRESQYGSPENNFASIARLWQDYFLAKNQNVCISCVDVAVMMSLLKIARIATGKFKADSYIDAAGYIACAAELETGGNNNAN